MLIRTFDSIAARGEALWLLFGRLALAALYVPSGFHKLMDPSRMAGMLEGKGFPAPMAWAILAGVVEFMGGLAIAAGYLTRLAAFVMIVFTIIAMILAHIYWNLEGAARYAQLIQFYKDLAIIGGFFFVFVRGAGPLSIDRR
jgi:putative oxidoreductase